MFCGTETARVFTAVITVKLALSLKLLPWQLRPTLSWFQAYQSAFPDIPIGYSGHETGIAISVAAVALGAKVVERHVTLDKTWKGSDHQASLEPKELAELVKAIRTVERAMGSPIKQLLPCEMACNEKVTPAFDSQSVTPVQKNSSQCLGLWCEGLRFCAVLCLCTLINFPLQRSRALTTLRLLHCNFKADLHFLSCAISVGFKFSGVLWMSPVTNSLEQ